MNLREGKIVKYIDTDTFEYYTETRIKDIKILTNTYFNNLREAFIYKDELILAKLSIENKLSKKISWYEFDQYFMTIFTNIPDNNPINKYIRIESILNISLPKLINFVKVKEREKIDAEINRLTKIKEELLNVEDNNPKVENN